MSRMRSAWLPGLCLCPLGRGRHSRGKVACLAHPPHTHPPKTNALAIEDVIDVVSGVLVVLVFELLVAPCASFVRLPPLLLPALMLRSSQEG